MTMGSFIVLCKTKCNPHSLSFAQSRGSVFCYRSTRFLQLSLSLYPHSHSNFNSELIKLNIAKCINIIVFRILQLSFA